MIDHDLIPVICASCNLEESEWETIDDVTLLSAIEEHLRPHDSMDFTVQLRQIKFNGNEEAGTLTQRYRLFAELFLGKLSEAKAAGFLMPENVIKLTFTRAVWLTFASIIALRTSLWLSVGGFVFVGVFYTAW